MYFINIDAVIPIIDVAKAIGTSQRNIGRWENSENEPAAIYVKSLAEFFGVSTDYLLGTVNNKSINVDGLTDTQIEAITMIVNELKATNKEK